MKNEEKCPKCQSENIYADGNIWVCPECAHEWSSAAKNAGGSVGVGSNGATGVNGDQSGVDNSHIRDAHGNILKDGDSVTVIKDLKVKGSSDVVKGGTKVKNIRLVDGGDGHDIACKIEGHGAMNLKSEFVKKVES